MAWTHALYIDLTDAAKVGTNTLWIVLRQVADRLSACVRGGDVLARVGGDEFVVLMPGVTYQADADIMSHQVRLALAHPFKVLGNEIVIGASAGAHLATTNEDPDQALRAADHAMYAVKDLGGDRRASRPVVDQSRLAQTGRPPRRGRGGGWHRREDAE